MQDILRPASVDKFDDVYIVSELMDTDFLTDLQAWLQHVAGQEGVDVGDHAAWDRWLHS